MIPEPLLVRKFTTLNQVVGGKLQSSTKREYGQECAALRKKKFLLSIVSQGAEALK